MSEINSSNFKKEHGDLAPDLVGVTELTSPYFFVPPSGTTAERPEDCEPGTLRFNTDIGNLEVFRGKTIGWESIDRNEIHDGTYPEARGFHHHGRRPGSGSINVIEMVRFSSLSTPIDFGDMIQSGPASDGYGTYECGAFASSTRGFAFGGRMDAFSNVIQFITMSTFGDSVDFGDLSEGTQLTMGVSDKTRGCRLGGIKYVGPQPYNSSGVNHIEFVTMTSKGIDASDFGDLEDKPALAGSCGDRTRGILMGGGAPSPSYNTDKIQYITIQSTGNAVDFGNMEQNTTYNAASSNSIRGISGGNGATPSNKIDFITISTTGNAQDFGDMAVSLYARSSCASDIRAIFTGGQDAYADCDFITIATTGNAIDFGNLSIGSGYNQGFSNSHGGLG